jgi:Zn-finger nucleic acid-binding protein
VDELICPQCQGTMVPKVLGHVSVRRCEDCNGVFLASSALGGLVEAENDWHAHQSANTAALPRITGDMTAPPAPEPRSRAFVETLFRS